jgi:hypothetical protein
MAKKLIFNMIRANDVREPVQYHPIIFMRGSRSWRLALHRDPVLAGKGEWTISDPVGGYRVCRVTASYKGVPVSSRDLTVTQARAAALVDLDLTVDRIGLDRFAQVLDAAQNPKPVHPLKG